MPNRSFESLPMPMAYFWLLLREFGGTPEAEAALLEGTGVTQDDPAAEGTLGQTLALVRNLAARLPGGWALTAGSSFHAATHGPLGFAAVSAVALGDVDDDGDLDVVLGVAGGGAETVWSNDGSGTFTLLGSFGAGDTRALVLADLDGDRDLDVVVGNLANGDTVWHNDGSGSFTGTLQSLGSSTTVALTGADVDQDGDLDYFGSFGLAGLHVFLNDGDANFLDGGPVGEASSSFATVAADFDRDGAPDVVAAGGGTAGEVVELHD